MSVEIQKEFQPSVKLLYKATREIFHLKKTSWFFYGFFVALPILIALLSFALSTVQLETVAMLLFCLTYAFAFMPALHYWSVKKSLMSNPSANQLQRYTISDKGVKNYSNGAEMRLSWNKITEIKTTKNLMFLYISNNCAYYIPISMLSENEIDQINIWKSQDA